MVTTTQTPALAKKPRNWSRQTKFKIRRTGLLKDPCERKGITKARVNRIVKQQNAMFAKGKFNTNMFTEGLKDVTRISQRASDASAQILERFLMTLLEDAGAAAKHAGRVTIKESDLKLALRRLRK